MEVRRTGTGTISSALRLMRIPYHVSADLLATLDMKMQHIGAQKYHLDGGTLHYLQVELSGALDAQ